MSAAAEADPLERLVAAVEEIVAPRSAAVGAYLHGSRARGEARPDSDADVLVLADATLDGSAREALVAEIRAAAAALPFELDLKVVPAVEFAPDPWVDLGRARWIAGRRWHEELPAQTVDDLAHESLGALRVLIDDDVFGGGEPVAGLRKSIGRLATIVAAVDAGAVSRSGSEAVAVLRGRSGPAEAVVRAWDGAGAGSGAASDPAVASLAQDALAAVLRELDAALTAGRLGPRSAERMRLLFADPEMTAG